LTTTPGALVLDRASLLRTAALPIDNVLKSLGSGLGGMTTAGAANALRQAGPNRIEAAVPRRLLAAFAGRFRNPLILVLLGAAAVSAFTGDVPSFAIIAVIVLASVILDVVQEHRAQTAAESLRDQVALSDKVMRDGTAQDIPSAGIVPGDLVLLAAGDLVPADARLTEAHDLYVNEALLTGEPYPAAKEVVPPPAGTAMFPVNLVFMGTSVVSGTARAMVLALATGARAQLGTIAQALQKPPPPSAFDVGIRAFGLMIVRLAILLLDRVDGSMLAKPRRWNLASIRRFMWVFGPLSAAFDLMTSGVLLLDFGADEVLFHTGWFVCSFAEQVLVIFIIRSTHPLRDRPHPVLAVTSLSALAVALALPYSPVAPWLGFVPVPVAGALTLLTTTYLLVVFGTRRWLLGVDQAG